MKFEVGQTLWYVRANRNRIDPPDDPGTEVRVVSVGRKWLGLDNTIRVNAETMEADGGHYTSPGRCYASRQEFEDWKAVKRAWDELRRLMLWEARPPKGMTLAQIQNATRSLFDISS